MMCDVFEVHYHVCVVPMCGLEYLCQAECCLCPCGTEVQANAEFDPDMVLNGCGL